MLVGGTATFIGAASTAAQTSGSQTHGGINNSGAIELGTSAASATLDIGAAVTLYGSGTLTLENSNDVVTGASGGGELFNYGTIAGAGSIDNSSGNGLTLTNEAGGVVDANVSGETLTLNTGNQIINDGLLEAGSGGTLNVQDAVIGSGNVTIASGGAVEFQSFFSEDVTFSGAGTLVLSHPGSFDPSQGTGGTISGFGTGDTLDLGGYNASAGDTFTMSATFDSGSDTTLLTVTDPTVNNSDTQSITLAGDYSTADFVLTQDNGTGIDVVFNPVVLPAGPVVAVENTRGDFRRFDRRSQRGRQHAHCYARGQRRHAARRWRRQRRTDEW